MKKIKLVIIGAGNIAKSHADVIKKFRDCEISSVFNRTSSKSLNFAKKYKIRNVHYSIDEMIKDIKPDGILILVSFTEIYEITKKIIKYKIPFFVEKPPGINLKQYNNLNILCQKYNTINMVGFNRRYYSIFLKGLKLLSKHGKILSFSIYGMERAWVYKKNKSILENLIIANSIHTIDLLNYFGGYQKKINIFNNFIKNKKFISSVINIKFKNDIIGTYNINTESPFFWSVKIFAENASLIYNNLDEGYILDKKFKIKKILPDEKDNLYKPGFYYQFKAFKKTIVTKKLVWPSVNIKQSYQSMKIADKLQKLYIK